MIEPRAAHDAQPEARLRRGLPQGLRPHLHLLLLLLLLQSLVAVAATGTTAHQCVSTLLIRAIVCSMKKDMGRLLTYTVLAFSSRRKPGLLQGRSARLGSARLGSTLLYSTLLYSTLHIPLHSTPLHSTPLHSTLLYSALLCSALL